MADPVTWLTQDAFDRLTSELEEMTNTGLPAIVRRIEAARGEGDLRENGGYHAAREEQAKMVSRISQLKALLANAQVGQAPESGVVAQGSVVEARVSGKPRRFLIGSREVAATSDLDVFSPRSPLGAAILGARPGQTRTYSAPTGREITVEIESVAPYTP